jgi:large subunit ribosomal protein L24
MQRIKVGDTVFVIAGKDVGKTGKVVEILKSKNRVKVEGVAIAKVSQKPSLKDPRGGIINKLASIHISNVMPVCPACKKPTRVKIGYEGEQKKRFCKKCNSPF